MTTSVALDEMLDGLPGADLVVRGLADLESGQPTAEAALVEVARTRIQSLGLRVAGSTVGDDAAELVLYARLANRRPKSEPYGLYCAWLEQLVSFLAALRDRRSWEIQRAPAEGRLPPVAPTTID